GFARRAGKVSVGSSQVQMAIKTKRALLVLFANDASEKTKEKILENAPGVLPRTVLSLSKAELGHLLGRDMVGVISVNDERFARTLKELIPQKMWIKPRLQTVKRERKYFSPKERKHYDRRRKS
ncbi:MAG TPA: hypothetical protein EYP14_16180, partial [Planctomycetaceae bacterium]|nr:hypothetical protein [Planctomycetaceae bacterium]